MIRLALLVVFCCAPALAQDQLAVRAALISAGQGQIAFTLPTRPFPPCDAALRAGPHQDAWAQAEITCDAPVWRRLVRLDGVQPTAPAEAPGVAATQQRLVTLRPIAKGDTIGPDDIALVPVISPAADSLTETSQAIGHVSRAALSRGQPLTARHLQPEFPVHAERPARLSVEAGRITVSQPVIPLQDGELGAMIRVRNAASGQVIWARVTGPDSLELQANTN